MKKFDNYKKNLSVLKNAGIQDLENEFIIGGIIDKFFVQFELAWKVLKELLVYDGVSAAHTGSPRDILKEAYRFYDCIEEDIWLEMLSKRNIITHIYDEAAAAELVRDIIERYIDTFAALQKSIEERYGDVLSRA